MVERHVSDVDGRQCPWAGDVGYSGESCDVIHAFIRAVILVPVHDLCEYCYSLGLKIRGYLVDLQRIIDRDGDLDDVQGPRLGYVEAIERREWRRRRRQRRHFNFSGATLILVAT